MLNVLIIYEVDIVNNYSIFYINTKLNFFYRKCYLSNIRMLQMLSV